MLLGIGNVLIGAGVAGMIANPKGRAPRQCPHCGVSLTGKQRRMATYCPYCGKVLPRGGYCPECDKTYQRGKYCPVHGTEFTSQEESEELDLDDRMLRVINANPEGITLKEIAKSLGTTWQQLLQSAKRLVENGKVNKEERTYFPK